MKTKEMIEWLKIRVIVGEWDTWDKEDNKRFATIIKRLKECEKHEELKNNTHFRKIYQQYMTEVLRDK